MSLLKRDRRRGKKERRKRTRAPSPSPSSPFLLHRSSPKSCLNLLAAKDEAAIYVGVEHVEGEEGERS
jgi:hypothetical protein